MTHKSHTEHKQISFNQLVPGVLGQNVQKEETHIHSQKKGTKAVTGAVPFQKVHFCPF